MEDIPTCSTLSYQLDNIRDTYAAITYRWLRFRRRQFHEPTGPQDEPPVAELGSDASQAFHTFLAPVIAQPTLFLNVCLSLSKEQRQALLQLFAFDTLTEFAQDHWPVVHLLLTISKQVGNNSDYTVDRALLAVAVNVCEILVCRFEVRAFCALVARETSEHWSNLVQCSSRDDMDAQGCRWLASFAKVLHRALALNRCPVVLCALFDILSSHARNLGISPSYVVTHCLLQLCVCCCVNPRRTVSTLTADLQMLVREVVDSRARIAMERLMFLTTAFQGQTAHQRLSLTLHAQIATVQVSVTWVVGCAAW
jgi:hypothetical protein